MGKHNLAWIFNNQLERLLNVRIERKERTFDWRRAFLVEQISPDLTLDGGANRGQWASALRSRFSDIEIWSFEPLLKPFNLLTSKCIADPHWSAFNVALGDMPGVLNANLASNQEMSSSLLTSGMHSVIHPKISFDSKEEVNVITLDSLLPQIGPRRIFLKLDLQGYEAAALEGALDLLKQVDIVEIESSFTPLYEGETAHHPLVSKLMKRGFTPFATSAPHQDRFGREFALDTLLVSDLALKGIYS